MIQSNDCEVGIIENPGCKCSVNGKGYGLHGFEIAFHFKGEESEAEEGRERNMHPCRY